MIVAVLAIVLPVVVITICVLGGIALHGNHKLAQLEKMSAMDMIEYSCRDKGGEDQHRGHRKR